MSEISQSDLDKFIKRVVGINPQCSLEQFAKDFKVYFKKDPTREQCDAFQDAQLDFRGSQLSRIPTPSGSGRSSRSPSLASSSSSTLSPTSAVYPYAAQVSASPLSPSLQAGESRNAFGVGAGPITPSCSSVLSGSSSSSDSMGAFSGAVQSPFASSAFFSPTETRLTDLEKGLAAMQEKLELYTLHGIVHGTSLYGGAGPTTVETTGQALSNIQDLNTRYGEVQKVLNQLVVVAPLLPADDLAAVERYVQMRVTSSSVGVNLVNAINPFPLDSVDRLIKGNNDLVLKVKDYGQKREGNSIYTQIQNLKNIYNAHDHCFYSTSKFVHGGTYYYYQTGGDGPYYFGTKYNQTHCDASYCSAPYHGPNQKL